MIVENKAFGLGGYNLIHDLNVCIGTKNYTTHTTFFEVKRVTAGVNCSIKSTQLSVLVNRITSGAKVAFSDPQCKIAYIY